MKLIGYIFLLATMLIARGFLFMKLWLWFVVPVFTTLPALNFNQSIGISFFILILETRLDNKAVEFEEVAGNWLIRMLYYGVALILGWGIYCAI